MAEEFKQKLKVEESERRPSENGDPDVVVVETEEAGIPGDEEGEYPEEEVYDSSKSFFDNITCESNSSGANRFG